jgi:hypothetical protein
MYTAENCSTHTPQATTGGKTAKDTCEWNKQKLKETSFMRRVSCTKIGRDEGISADPLNPPEDDVDQSAKWIGMYGPQQRHRLRTMSKETTQNDDKGICRDTMFYSRRFAVFKAQSTVNTATTKVNYLHLATLQNTPQPSKTETTLQDYAVY